MSHLICLKSYFEKTYETRQKRKYKFEKT